MTQEARNIIDVIPLMLEIIPKEEVGLINDILKFEDKLEYQPPEVLNSATVWIPLQQILKYHISNIDSQWKINLRVLFNNEKE